MGNGNYLGQDFYGVQQCPTCRGKGVVSRATISAGDDSDSSQTMDCPDCTIVHKSWCLIDKPECGPVHCTCWREVEQKLTAMSVEDRRKWVDGFNSMEVK